MIFRQSCLALLGNVLLVGAAAAAPPPVDYRGGCTDAGCHTNFTKFKNVHSPVETGACDACHEAVPDKGHKFQWAAEPDELCLDCHDSIVEDLKFLHGPVAAGTCTSCHDPHASNEPALLTAAGPTLCTNCHTSIQEALASRPSKHAPVEEGCLSCHNPHGGVDRFNLSSQPPELCLDCHDTIADIIEEASVQHPVVTAGQACLTCHDPHASDFGPILKGKPLDLCMSCHEKDQKSETRILRGLGQLLKDKPHHHGPVGDGSCTDCHQPHGGEHFRMLTSDYPAAFYASFSEERYALCFECHDSDLFLDDKTTDGTGFRNGDQNLHFLHVNRPTKGRSCRACHDPHASGNPFHITDSVRFGNWNLPLNFEQHANGGGCQPGCHKRYRYDRTTPVANISK